MSTTENIFRQALARASADVKALDKPAKAMVSQFLLDSRLDPFQETFEDAVAERLLAKGNKARQALISSAWTLASKRLYWHLGQVQLRPIFPSICSGGQVEIKAIADARRDNAAATQAKADALQAAAERSASRSEEARIDKMRHADATSIADSLRETLLLSGVSVAALAWALTHGSNPSETWEKFIGDVGYMTTNPLSRESTAAEAATSVAAPSLETA